VVGDREGKMKIGVLGGTFDPVHLGHITMAEEVRKALGLEEILLVPAGEPVSKKALRITPASHRLEMLRLAAADKPHLKVSTIEMERPGPSYTADTLAELKNKYGDKAEIYFILGWDSLSQLPEWREPGRIIGMCHLVAVPRPGFPGPDLDALERALPGISGKVVLMDKPRLDISASAVREMAARSESIERLVPAPVAAYIRKNRLYSGS
jgi:nicotinate-nucleotide adenylyltransferase